MVFPKGKHAWTVVVGEKGQIGIPKQAREIFDIKPGDSLLLLDDERQGLPFHQAEHSGTFVKRYSAR